MSTSELVCRVCLAGGNVGIHAIEDKKLLDTYEKLTGVQLDTEDGRPNTLCYICVSQLQRCSIFSDMALRSDEVLQALLRDSVMIKYSTIAALKLGNALCLLTTTATRHVSTDDCTDNQGSLCVSHNEYVCMYDSIAIADVKEEQVTVKEEATTKIDIFNEINKNSLVETDETGNSLKKEQSSNEDFYLHCDKCKKKFNKLLNFKIHLKTHTVKSSFTCKSCSKTFNYIGHLNRHMRSHIKSYVCDRCSKKFKLKSAFEAHMRTHTGEKPFACEVCGKTFNQKSHLKTHSLTHSADKSYSCSECGNAFRQRAQLASHMRSHTGERPYACDLCNMTFSHHTTLKKHKRLHTEVKSYACTRCAVSFERESSLTTHMRVHTAVRPHACRTCGRSFFEARYLKEHVRTVHSSERPHVCACGKAYKRAEHLKQHLRTSRCDARLLSPTFAPD